MLRVLVHSRSDVRAGGGGASGSATLETLMEKLSFGPKPKIVDLTSQRRLADKVSSFLGPDLSCIALKPLNALHILCLLKHSFGCLAEQIPSM